MDSFNDPRIELITVMSASQIGKTEIINNILGYHIEHDPSPILFIMPTLEMATAWSKDRFAPMLRDTPSLRGKVTDARAKESSNTILHKVFPGGHITVAGANSPASLASRPVRLVLFDEVDRYPPSAGTEGDPILLGAKRTQTFWNRKILHNSTPTVQGVSRIESLFWASDQRHYYVPCPHCAHAQILLFGPNSVFRNLGEGCILFDHHNASWVHYQCEHCKGTIEESHKQQMIRAGEWLVTQPEKTAHAGFHISELYSPWSTWRALVVNFLEAKKRQETLKVWINTCIGETWTDEESYTISDEKLAERIEDYVDLPGPVAVLTAGVDVQDDRIECVVKGWGVADESWFIEHKVFYGSPAKDDIWSMLDHYLQGEWKHEYGLRLRISSVCIDSAGHFTQNVYAFAKVRQARRWFAIKGHAGTGRALVGKPSVNNRYRIPLFTLGVDTAKELIYARLQIEDPGPGYMHFSRSCDEEYFRQLTAEKQVTTFRRGFPMKEWIKVRPRNEALDCEVYALAAFHLLNANIQRITDDLKSRGEALKREMDEAARREVQLVPIFPKRRHVIRKVSRPRGPDFGW